MFETQPPLILLAGSNTEIFPATLELPGFRLKAVESLVHIRHQLQAARCDLIVLAASLQGSDGEDLLIEEALQELAFWRAGIPVLIWDPQAGASDGARYVRLGADDAASRAEELPNAVQRLLDRHEPGSAGVGEAWRKMLVGASTPMRRAAEVIRMVAQRRSTVLITGETGTGKELLAKALHLASPRGHLPMVAINVAALPANLLEAELFGHVRGAFTGAVQQRMGRFEQANRSTLFLDEIGDLPIEVQTKLLRFLQEREFQRVGSSETVRVDVRLIAATNVPLLERVREGRFREDLYYRLNVVPMQAPSLRERTEDIPLLAAHFAEKICLREEIPLRRFSPEALQTLARYDWPGNVRQFENALEMAIAMSGDRELLYPSDFVTVLGASQSGSPRTPSLDPDDIELPPAGLDFDRTVGSIERKIIEEALRKTGGNKTAAAEMLGLKRTTLAAKLKSLEVSAGAA